MPITQECFPETARIIATAIVSSALSSLFTHLYAKNRDKKRRLVQLAAIFEQCAAESATWDATEFPTQYGYKIPSLRYEQHLIGGDIPDGKQAEFGRLVDAACGYTQAEAKTPDTQKRITESFREVSKFLKDAA